MPINLGPKLLINLRVPLIMPCGWWHHSHGRSLADPQDIVACFYENVSLAQEVTGGSHFPDICLYCHQSRWHKSHKSRCVDYAIFMFAFAGRKTTESKRMWHALPLTTMRSAVRRSDAAPTGAIKLHKKKWGMLNAFLGSGNKDAYALLTTNGSCHNGKEYGNRKRFSQKGSLSSKDAKQQRQRKPSNNDAKMQFHVRICHKMSGETDTKHYG